MKKIQLNIPDWVNWSAQNRNGRLTFFEQEPGKMTSLGYWHTREGRVMHIDIIESAPKWEESLSRIH